MIRDSFIEDKEPIANIVSRIFCVIFLIISAGVLFNIGIFGLLPTKYFFLLFIILLILNIIFGLSAYRRRSSKKTLITFNIIMIIISVLLIFAGIKLDEIGSFIHKNFDDNKKYAIYEVIVSKNSKVNSFNDLYGSELFTYEEPVKEVQNNKLNEAVKNVISDSTLLFKDDLDVVMNRVISIPGAASVVNNGTFESYISVNEDYEEKIKIIGEIKIEVLGDVSEEEEIKDNPITNTPFLFYISGIDTRTNEMPTRSLSDVNILMAVNPKTKKIAIVNIPRDTYVYVHGDTDKKDKLTHAGARGGVELSKETIEDFIGLKINRYMRVNFNFISELVDKVGGIEVYSSESKSYKTAYGGCKINPGKNTVDGKCALGFVRERKSLKDGDRQRGKNQMQVIKTLFAKIAQDKSLIANYSAFLESLNGTFETSLTSSETVALIRMQINDMAEWKIETYEVNGSDAMETTASYPDQKLYVMKPNQSTVDNAKKKLEEVLK